jgi:hypothetical protein
MNYTRIFAGSYVEIPGSFGIENNSLAPAVGSFIAPWKRVDEPGLFKGEKKFDLNEWNPTYFERLKDFISLADEFTSGCNSLIKKVADHWKIEAFKRI